MRDRFEKYLIAKGYKTATPTGKPSTVYDYIKRIDHVCQMENISSWDDLAKNINSLILEYDVGGAKQCLGEKSHRSVINALKRFSEFLKD